MKIRIGFLLFVFVCKAGYGQENVSPQDSVRRIPQIDIFDVLRKLTKKPIKPEIDIPVAGVKNLSLLPIVGYSPANGFVIGAAVSVTELLGDPKFTQLSTALLNISFTTKDQTLLNLRFDMYTPHNKWYISGDNRLLLFTQPTYGLGINGLNGKSSFDFNAPGELTHDLNESPMSFNYIRLYETFLRKIRNHWYAGMGVMIDYNFKIRDESLSLDSPVHLTPHYIYSKNYGFDSAHYSANGLSFVVMHDSRDNPVNPYKGNYLNVNFRVNPTFLGSSQNSTMLYYEYRTYLGVSKATPRNLISFWFWGVDVLSGHLPYLALPAITWDTYNRSGRGYIQGRFRGDNMMYGESEFRYQITKDGLLGGVVFINCTTASNPLPVVKQDLFASLAPGYGVGLRIKMNKNDRTNIAIDYGRGDGFSGIYFNIREAF